MNDSNPIVRPNTAVYKEAVSKEESRLKRDIKPITKAKVRKVPLVKRIANIFIDEDIGDPKQYLWYYVVRPAIRGMIVDGVERLFGNSRNVKKNPNNGQPYISYNAPVKNVSSPYDPTANRRKRIISAYENLVIPSREQAEAVIEELYGDALEYGLVSVAELYARVGLTPNTNEEDFGWTKDDLEKAQLGVSRVNDGYCLILPKARILK